MVTAADHPPNLPGLHCFVDELERRVADIHRPEELREAARMLTDQAHAIGLPPQRLLVIIKRACPWLRSSQDGTATAESTDESRRYSSALDVLWTCYFAPARAGE